MGKLFRIMLVVVLSLMLTVPAFALLDNIHTTDNSENVTATGGAGGKGGAGGNGGVGIGGMGFGGSSSVEDSGNSSVGNG